MKKITILVHDLSKNGIVRVYPIAKVLERHFDVEIVGFNFEKEIFPIYKNEFKFKIFKTSPDFHMFIFQIPKVIKAIDGDIIYAFKPRVSSFGIALLAKLLTGKPLVMDNEDWEGEHYYMAKNWIDKLKLLRKRPLSVDNPFYRGLMEKFILLADDITVVSSFLENRSGGKRLVHGADCELFNPYKYDRNALRVKWGVKEKFVVLFTGTVFPHKGLEKIIDSFRLLKDDRLVLVVVGVDNPHVKELKAYSKEKLIFLGPHPHEKMPELLAVADTVILPLQDTLHAQAQVPGKVFEAMAMAKPIIATKVSDLPEILENCGIIINENSPESIASALVKLITHPELAMQLGNSARKKCIKKYSWKAMEKTLLNIFDKY